MRGAKMAFSLGRWPSIQALSLLQCLGRIVDRPVRPDADAVERPSIVPAPAPLRSGGIRVGLLAVAEQFRELRLDLFTGGVEFVEDAVGLLHIVRADVERDPCVILSLEGRGVAGTLPDPRGEESPGMVEVLPCPGGESRPHEFCDQRLEEVVVEPGFSSDWAPSGTVESLIPAAGPHHLVKPRLRVQLSRPS